MKFFWNEIKILVLWFIGSSALLLLFFLLSDLNVLDVFLYYSLLNLILFLFLLFLLNSRLRKLIIFLKNEKEETYPNDLGDTTILKGLQQKFEKKKKFYQHQLLVYQKSNEEHQLFINKWVHYIKTPLSVIRIITQEDKTDERLQQIQQEGDKILYGVNMALYFARSTNFTNDFKFEKLFLRQTFIEIINELKRFFIVHDVFPMLEVAEDLQVVSDKNWLKVIFYQLITNAVKYSKKGNKITIYTRKDERGLWCCIQDTGKGIPKQDMERIFDLFFTGKNGREYGESTGIGLFLVQKICDGMNYLIEVESKEGKGTIFSIRMKEQG